MKIDLTALEAIHAKATPGPWVVEHSDQTTPHMWIVHQNIGDIHRADICKFEVSDAGSDGIERIQEIDFSNADTIVAAHNALPALIARIRELEVAVATARDVFQLYGDLDPDNDKAARNYDLALTMSEAFGQQEPQT